MQEKRQMTVKCLPPLDCYLEYTQPVHEWLHGQLDPDWRSQVFHDFLRAVEAVSQHPSWDGEPRHVPHIAYNAASDEPYFIFKLNDNGTTFLVGDSVPDVEECE